MCWSSGECEVSVPDLGHELKVDIQAGRYSRGSVRPRNIL